MAGHAASRTIPFGSESGPQRQSTCVIQIKAPLARMSNDPSFPLDQLASLPAQEDRQP